MTEKLAPVVKTLEGSLDSTMLKGLMLALESAGVAAVIFGPDDKLVTFTNAYWEMNEDIRKYLKPGINFIELCKMAVGRRSLGEDSPVDSDWLEERARKFRSPEDSWDELHANGKWYRQTDYRTSDDYYIGLRQDVTDEHTVTDQLDNLIQRFQSLAELTSDFFWEMDADLRFTNFYGRNSDQAFEDAPGRLRWDTATENDLRDTEKWSIHRQQLEARLPFRDFEFEIASTPLVWARVSGEPVYNKAGDFVGYIGTTSDITAQKRSEDQLLESESLYRNLVEGSVLGVVVHANNYPLYANKAVAEMLGYSVEEILALGSLDQLFTGVALARHQEYQAARTAGEDVLEQYETEWIRKDGATITIKQMSERINWAGKDCIQATIIDVTAEKKAETEIREQERRIRLLADGLPINIVYVDQSQCYRFVNNAYLAWYGEPQENILGRTVRNVMGDTAYEIVRKKIEAALDGEQQNFEIEIPFVSMGRKLVQTIYVPHRNDFGEVMGIYGLVIDITKQKQAEQAALENEIRYSRMLAIAPDAIIATNGDLDIRIFNKGAEEVFGYSADEVIGQNINTLLPARYHHMHAGHVERFLQEPDDSRMMSERGEIFGCRKDGQEFPAEASISKLRMGEETVLTVMLHDITKRKETENELIRAKEQAEYADRAKSEFLANMSHELRTPLNAILGFSDMMNHQTFGPLGDQHYKEYSEGIFDSGDHLLSLINDILDISKIEAGRVELDNEDLLLSEVIHDCLRIVGPRVEDAGLAIEPASEAGPTRILADERLVKQMLLNLLSNAIKFTEAGGQISLDTSHQTDGTLCLTVIDTGIGISAADLPRAMETFGQVESALDRKYEGTGLGLPLVKSLIELHDGSFDLQSTQGVGTRASLFFPAARVINRA